MFLKKCLDRQSVQPVGDPDFSRFRLFDMFCSCTQSDVKEISIILQCQWDIKGGDSHSVIWNGVRLSQCSSIGELPQI